MAALASPWLSSPGTPHSSSTNPSSIAVPYMSPPIPLMPLSAVRTPGSVQHHTIIPSVMSQHTALPFHIIPNSPNTAITIAQPQTQIQQQIPASPSNLDTQPLTPPIPMGTYTRPPTGKLWPTCWNPQPSTWPDGSPSGHWSGKDIHPPVQALPPKNSYDTVISKTIKNNSANNNVPINSKPKHVVKIDDTTFVTAGEIIHIWNSKTSEVINFVVVNGTVESLAITPDKRILWALDSVVNISDPTSLECVGTFTTSHLANDTVTNILCLLEEQVVCTNALSTGIKIWDLRSNHTHVVHTDVSVTSLADLWDGRIAVATSDGSIRCLSQDGWKWTVKTHHQGFPTALASTNPSLLVSSDTQGKLQCWNPARGQYIKYISAYTDRISTLAVLSNDRVAVASGCSIKIFKVPSLECHAELLGHADPVIALCQISDGVIVSIDAQGVIKLWTLIDSPEKDLVGCWTANVNGASYTFLFGGDHQWSFEYINRRERLNARGHWLIDGDSQLVSLFDFRENKTSPIFELTKQGHHLTVHEGYIPSGDNVVLTKNIN